jgi:hypothetical protein
MYQRIEDILPTDMKLSLSTDKHCQPSTDVQLSTDSYPSMGKLLSMDSYPSMGKLLSMDRLSIDEETVLNLLYKIWAAESTLLTYHMG